MPIDTLLTILLVLVGVLVGYGIGVLSSGIKIYHLEKLPKDKQEKPEYNESMADYLPPEQRQYYEQNQGRNAW